MSSIRRCLADERHAMLSVINAAAEAYRDVIPADRWRDPYMPLHELDVEIAGGVDFWGYEADGCLIGVMGIQSVLDVDLIRHAYVLPRQQRLGIGGALLSHLRPLSTRRMLVGTWAAAHWAIRFYQRHAFELLDPERSASLLRRYWKIPDRQIETSVVLESPPRRCARESTRAAVPGQVSAEALPRSRRQQSFRRVPQCYGVVRRDDDHGRPRCDVQLRRPRPGGAPAT